jgi:hypothetical protein
MPRQAPALTLLEQHPQLTPWPTKPNLSTAALGARNLRAELKKAFPTVKFSVTSEYYAGGCAIRAEVQLFQADGYTAQDARRMETQASAISMKFAYGTFDGMTDSYNYKNDPDTRAFQDAFGSAQYVSVTIRIAPEHKEDAELLRRAEAKKKKLAKVAAKHRPSSSEAPITPKF